ncbi:MAG TPA: 6-carboxytetrahydropterin synthase QueD [Deltaproteobacteria bacterium]|nr:MAG: 6-carboxytetrahydropterin synthase QueD [Deltaproteobacteria bacterium]HEC32408.1 6-carboxytetrahydropterin synthase QueD [Deltaproteobacteria bacterium]
MAPLYEVKIITGFAAAHNLRNFKGKCENLHGHNWKIEVVLRGQRLDDCDLLIDFAKVKAETNRILDELDHNYLNDIPFFQENNPSSENIARYIFEKLTSKFENKGISVYSVSAWESENACATYYGS